MTIRDDLIRFKTDAWKAQEMAAWYAQRMDENVGSNRLLHKVEIGLIGDWAKGEDILDVGIGTGRASLPLARAGRRVTGIDSSAAMLEECRRLAAGTPVPVRLQVGDVTRLPVPDAAFDTAMALNVMTHMPHWREILPEWRRVVRPGGRVAFDIYSLDHLEWLRGHPVSLEDLAAGGVGAFNMHIRVADLLAWAEENDMSVEAVLPYGALFSGEFAYRHASALPLLKSHWWQRHMAWLSVDEALVEFGLFIERELFGRLTSEFTGRFVAVLANRADAAANARWREEWRQRSEQARRRLDCASLGLAATEGESFRVRLAGLLDGRPRHQAIFFILLRAVWPAFGSVDWADLAGATAGRLLADFERKEDIDRQTFALCRGWDRLPAFAQIREYKGVPLAPASEYGLSRRILKDYFGCFETP